MQRFVGDRGHVMLQVTMGSLAEASCVERTLDVLEIEGRSQHHAGNEWFPFTTSFRDLSPPFHQGFSLTLPSKNYYHQFYAMVPVQIFRCRIERKISVALAQPVFKIH